VVGWLYSVYLWVSLVCVFSFYRWEVYLLGLCARSSRLSLLRDGSVVFSFKFLVCGVLFVVLYCFFII
jgi:hypothetical protein